MAQQSRREAVDLSSPESKPYKNSQAELAESVENSRSQNRRSEGNSNSKRERSRDGEKRNYREAQVEDVDVDPRKAGRDQKEGKDRARESTSASGEQLNKRRAVVEDYGVEQDREYDYDPEACYSAEKFEVSSPGDYRRGGYESRPMGGAAKVERGLPMMDMRNFRPEQALINHHENERRRKISSWIITERKRPSPLRPLNSYYHVARYVKDS